MFWADKLAEETIRRYQSTVDAGAPLIVRDEKTASGHAHVGSLRSAAMHAMVADVLNDRGIKAEFHFEINDFDPMDGIPKYLDEATYKKYLGRPLCNIPSPEPGFANFAELYGQEYVNALMTAGFNVTVYRASELYRSGAMNELIKKALDNREQIREIYYRVSKSEKGEDWFPLNVVCANCGNLSATKITDWDGETVGYTCSSDTIEWAEGCGHTGRISPLDGNAKFPWKVDWAAKFVAKGVHFEGGGKDHYTKGGARQVAEAIAREVFDHEPPYGVFNEFFLVGGKKMSSSKGNAATAAAMVTILPAHILRLLLIKSPINRQLDFDPEGDAIPVLFDTYDRLAEKTWSGVEDDDTRIFRFAHVAVDRADRKRFLPRFSQIAFLVQMPHMDIESEVSAMKGSALGDADREEIALRITYAKKWLTEYADYKFIFTLQTTLPDVTDRLSASQKQALEALAAKIAAAPAMDGPTLHEFIHDVKADSGLTPQEFFQAIYLVFLGKDSGPKVGWFLSTLERDFVINRLQLCS